MSLGFVAMQASLDPITAVLPIDAVECRATAAGLSFVARLVGVIEIRAARPLQEIAGGGCLVAQLA